MQLFIIDFNTRASIYGIGTYRKTFLNAISAHDDVEVFLVNVFDAANKLLKIQVNEQYTEIWIPLPETTWISAFSDNNHANKRKYCQRISDVLHRFIHPDTSPVVHFNHSNFSILANELKTRLQANIVFAVHSLNWYFQYENEPAKFAASWKELEEPGNTIFKHCADPEEQRMCDAADKIICLSERTYGFVQRVYQIDADKIIKIQNGLQVPVLHTDPIQLRPRYGLSPDTFVLLFAGRIAKSKGLDFMLKGVERFIATYPDRKIKMLMAGNGDYDPFMSNYKSLWQHIIWAGVLPREELNELYQLSDVGITLSLFEQCSYTAIEMMQFGLPVIYAKCSGLDEMFEDGTTGLGVTVEYGEDFRMSEEQICQHISLLYEQPVFRKALGARGRSAALINYDLSARVADTKQVYQVLNEHYENRLYHTCA